VSSTIVTAAAFDAIDAAPNLSPSAKAAAREARAPT
jgi:hypothetical protein